MSDDERVEAEAKKLRGSLRSEVFTLSKEIFEHNEWPHKVIDDFSLRTMLGGEYMAFSAMVRATDHWMIVSVNPFVRRPVGGFGPVALKAMCSANHLMNLVKIGLDPEGDVFLAVELPAEGFCESHLFDALASLTHYGDDFHVPLLQAIKIDKYNQAAE